MKIARHSLRLLPPTVALVLTACGGTKPATAPSPQVAAGGDSARAVVGIRPETGEVMRANAPAARRTDRQTITREEILKTEYTNMYDVILALRGNWLRVRAAESIEGKSSRVQVYLDTQHLPSADDLRAISPRNIASVRYLDPIQASARWGMDHGSGAILVTTAKQ